MTMIVGSGNPDLGVVQTQKYLDRIESLPSSQIALSLFGESVDIPSFSAEAHTIRSYNNIDVTTESLIPLNPNVINSERIATVTGNVITLTTEIHAITIIIAEKSRVNSPENIFAATSTLLSDYEMRLKEKLILNMLWDSNLIDYTFEKGGSGSISKMNINDLIEVTDMMQENSVSPIISFISASPDTYTRPIPMRYALVTSIKGASAVKKNLSSTDFTQIHTYAGMSSYDFPSKGTIEKANLELLASSEINDEVDGREGYVFGAQPFYKTGRTPLRSRINLRPASESAYGMHSKVEKVTVFGVALANQNRVIKISFTD